MEPPNTELESRLQKVLLQLNNEMIIFERLMYKNTNQHRRALYFRRLCQVRSELHLLRSACLSGLLQSFKQCHQNSFQSREEASNISNVKDLRRRIYGAVRLLDQIAESILSASLYVADLLGQTFFMAFALTMLAILARLRVLSQQALHDFVHIFNLLSTWSKHKPEENGELPNLLECKWDDEGKLSFEPRYTHQHETVANITDQKRSVPCSSVPEKLLVEPNSGGLTEEQGTGKGLKLSIPDTEPSSSSVGQCGFTAITAKKVAYVSACEINLPRTEKSEDTSQHTKKQKTDALYDMLLGLHDISSDTLF